MRGSGSISRFRFLYRCIAVSLYRFLVVALKSEIVLMSLTKSTQVQKYYLPLVLANLVDPHVHITVLVPVWMK